MVPSECDLTDFAFMPLQVSRLRRSKAWLKCKRNPALAFYMINLWTASWHDKPAGSLENDDDVLADLAMCDPSKWDKLKGDVLHGWVECSDGRLYHPVVAEKAVESWNAKLDQRWRTECARIKKHADRYKMSLLRPTFEEWMSQGCPQGQRLPVPRDTSGTGIGQVGETPSKGEGEGQRQREGQGQGDSLNTSVPYGTGGQPPVDPPKVDPAGAVPPAVATPPKSKERSPEERTKADVWRAAIAVLQEGGCKDEAACRLFMGKLVKDHTLPVVQQAVTAAVAEQPADARSWLTAACQRIKGERTAPGVLTGEQQISESLAKAARLQAAMAAAKGAVRPAETPMELIDG